MLIANVNCTIPSMRKKTKIQTFKRRFKGRKENILIKKINKQKRTQVQNNLGYTV